MIIHFSLNCGPYRQLPGRDESEKRVKTAVYHRPMRAFLVALQYRFLQLPIVAATTAAAGVVVATT
jgi:hypothetical protein